MKNLHLRALLEPWSFHLFKTSMFFAYGRDLWLMENEFLHQLRYVNSPGFNLGIFDHAIYQLVWSPWLLPSTVTSRNGFLQKSHLADRTQEVQQHSKGMELLKAAWEATGDLEWLVNRISWWNRHGRFFHLGTSSLSKKPAESQMSKEGTWVTSSYLLSAPFLESLMITFECQDTGTAGDPRNLYTNQKPIPNPTSVPILSARWSGLWSIMCNERRTWRWSRIPNLDKMREKPRRLSAGT